MKIFLMLVAALSTVSCMHTAIAPVSSPSGELVVVKVPNARLGEKLSVKKLEAMNQKIENDIVAQLPTGAVQQNRPSYGTEGGVLSLAGEFTTKKGDKFVGFSPVVMIKSAGDADEIDRMAGNIAAAYYRSAKKLYQVYPLSSLKPSKSNHQR